MRRGVFSLSSASDAAAPAGAAMWSYRPDIDGVRAIAITAVVLFHAGIKGFGGGFVGVDIFFVISGYLITGHVYRDVIDSRFSLASFYARRARRILPALLVVLLVSLAIGFVLLSTTEYQSLAKSTLGALFGVSNIYYWFSIDYFSPESDHLPMLMTWSLGVEEQFYVFLPVVIVLGLRFFEKRIIAVLAALCGLSFLSSIVLLGRAPSFVFYMLPTRAWELGLGGMLAVAELRGLAPLRDRRIFTEIVATLGLACLAAAIALLDSSVPFPGALALLPTLGAALVIAAPGSVASRLLSLRPIVFVGLVSYSWYLWHWPLLSFARITALWPLGRNAALIIVGLSFGLAVLSYYTVERPCRRRIGANGPTLLRYGGAMAAAALVIVAVTALGGLPQRLPRQAAALTEVAADWDLCLVFDGVAVPPADPICRPAVPAERLILVIGDSHAAALAPGLRARAHVLGYELAVLAKASCPPLLDVTLFTPANPAHSAECMSFHDQVMAWIKANPGIRKVILAGFWSAPMIAGAQGEAYVSARSDEPERDNAALLERGLTAEVAALRGLGLDVAVVQDVPFFAFEPTNYLLQRVIAVRAALGGLLGGPRDLGQTDGPARYVINRNDATRDIIRQVAAATQGVAVVDPFDSLCTADRCRLADEDGSSLYKDSQHLSARGSEAIAKAILP